MLAWKFNDLNTAVASVRYRGLKPVQVLAQTGIKSQLLRGRQEPDWGDVEAYINVKSYTFHDLRFVQMAAARGVPVVLDLCDNIFLKTYQSKKTADPAVIFLAMVRHASAIVTTSDVLAKAIADNVPGSVPIHVITDGIENVNDLDSFDALVRGAALANARHRANSLFADGKKAALRKLLKSANGWKNDTRQGIGKLFLSNRRPKKRAKYSILWFGNHGASHAQFGMLDLLDIRPALAQISLEFDVELIVISNNLKKYEEHIAEFEIPSRYVTWELREVYRWIELADLVVLPNSLNEFSVCKSANRSVLALSLGTPVVASKMPVYAPLADAMLFDDWENNIRSLLSRDPDAVTKMAATAAQVLDEYYSDRAILQRWKQLIDHVTQESKSMLKKTIGFYVGLVTDVEVLMPLMSRFSADYQTTAIVELKLLERYPDLWDKLPLEAKWVISTKEDLNVYSEKIAALDVLLTAAESNLRPHKLVHAVTKAANSHGVVTVTMQHGYENIGLTYSDSTQPAEKIAFAAQHILTWSKPELLLENVSDVNRAKVYPVGCFKTPANLNHKVTLPGSFDRYVGVFENLHWIRYSDEYRAAFLGCVDAMAQAYPDTGFVLKPHQAGQWLTHRYEGDIPSRQNILVLDPTDPEWRYCTAPQLFGSLAGVISSPSTVVVDGVLAGLPTAVAAFDEELSNFAPLDRLRNQDDWAAFINKTADGEAEEHHSLAEGFLRQNFAPGEPLDNIAQFIESQLTSRDIGQQA